MGKNSTKAEKAKRNLEYAMAFKKKAAPKRYNRPKPSYAVGTTPSVSTDSRPMFKAICATCGVETTVPFEPTSGKPVYCRNCFQPKPRI
ncbi:MAG TPA: hypothetical protein DD435_01175 [Cyanobacteria bacterium UBA8530]|nr:hypothetical protein [Cyanobacteria bacterium UBA8530]